MNLNKRDYIKKVAGCWMGKNIGGTVGAPFEWKRQINDVTFYTQELDGNPLPNDDLDIQLLWLIALEREGVNIDATALGDYWLNFVTPHWAEYGNGKINMRNGLVPPISGMVNNMYKDSCGSFIRSEIWACLCPGAPMRAALYALADSAIDHGDGEGTYAEIFTAVLESAAFVENDLNKLIDVGLHFIPDGCAIAGAVNLAMACRQKGLSWKEARDEILTHYRGMAAYGSMDCISKDDVEKGFFDGKLGWDAPSNIGMLIIGLLYGENDFEKTMCITVNCGEDTDCTAATAGSILGIMNGIDYIPQKWIQPIGRSIKTVTLNLGDLTRVPQDIDNLTERTMQLAHKVIDAYKLPLTISEAPTQIDADLTKHLYPDCTPLYENFGCAVFSFTMLKVAVDYNRSPYINMDGTKDVVLCLENKFPCQQNIEIKVLTDGALTAAQVVGNVFIGNNRFDCKKTINLHFTAEVQNATELRAVVQLTSKGRHTTVLVPILLLQMFQ